MGAEGRLWVEFPCATGNLPAKVDYPSLGLAWTKPVERKVVGEGHACSKKLPRLRGRVVTAESRDLSRPPTADFSGMLFFDAICWLLVGS